MSETAFARHWYFLSRRFGPRGRQRVVFGELLQHAEKLRCARKGAGALDGERIFLTRDYPAPSRPDGLKPEGRDWTGTECTGR
ncbi:hypothetical protein HYQ46_009997 [Verticillium longisporum]|nr:hypothetical protein HYQ46_009997 [Verticillium longisporum]